MPQLFARAWPLLPPVRWARTLLGLGRGVRIHPGAVIRGALGHVSLTRGSKLSKGVVLDPGCTGSISLGRDVWLASDVLLETSTRLTVGEDTTIQRRSSINGTVRIGSSCILAPNVFISSGTHPFRVVPHLTIREQERQLGDAVVGLDRPVWIQDDCWLGTNVVVMPGVTIGKGCVIGANSVVTRDVAPYSVVAGAPARVIGQRLEWSPPSVLHLDRDEHLPYVLSGRIERDGGGRLVGVQVDGSADCWIALPPFRDSIRLKLQAVGTTRLMIGGHAFPLAAGPSTLMAPVASLPPHDARAPYCIHVASDQDPRVKILIERIECF